MIRLFFSTPSMYVSESRNLLVGSRKRTFPIHFPCRATDGALTLGHIDLPLPNRYTRFELVNCKLYCRKGFGALGCLKTNARDGNERRYASHGLMIRSCLESARREWQGSEN